MNRQLCWNCKNACGNCSWSDGTFTPVEGWDATPTKILHSSGNIKIYTDSFDIKKCPEFIHDIPIRLSKKEIAEKLGISMRTYYRWIKKGKIKKHSLKSAKQFFNKKRQEKC